MTSPGSQVSACHVWALATASVFSRAPAASSAACAFFKREPFICGSAVVVIGLWWDRPTGLWLDEKWGLFGRLPQIPPARPATPTESDKGELSWGFCREHTATAARERVRSVCDLCRCEQPSKSGRVCGLRRPSSWFKMNFPVEKRQPAATFRFMFAPC